MSILLPAGVVKQDPEVGPIVNGALWKDNLSFACLDHAPNACWHKGKSLFEPIKSQCAITDRGLAFPRQAINAPGRARQ